MSRDAALEAEIQARGLNAPRVRPEDVDAAIEHVEYVKHVSHSGQVLRWCVLTLRNGFSVAGKPSCSASSENDNAAIGEKVALANSREEVWPLLGYALKERLNAGPAMLNLEAKLSPEEIATFKRDWIQEAGKHPLHAVVVPDRSLD